MEHVPDADDGGDGSCQELQRLATLREGKWVCGCGHTFGNGVVMDANVRAHEDGNRHK